MPNQQKIRIVRKEFILTPKSKYFWNFTFCRKKSRSSWSNFDVSQYRIIQFVRLNWMVSVENDYRLFIWPWNVRGPKLVKSQTMQRKPTIWHSLSIPYIRQHSYNLLPDLVAKIALTGEQSTCFQISYMFTCLFDVCWQMWRH